jgi:hypothetical protein
MTTRDTSNVYPPTQLVVDIEEEVKAWLSRCSCEADGRMTVMADTWVRNPMQEAENMGLLRHENNHNFYNHFTYYRI